MRVWRTVLLLGVASIGLSLLGACGGSDSVGEPRSRAEQLDGRTFVAQQLSQDGASLPLAPGSTMTVGFSGGKLTASAGCNTMGGSFTIEGTALVVGTLAMTEMACAEAIMAQEQWLSHLLSSKPTVGIEGVSLTLAGEGSTAVLIDRAVAEAAPPIRGTTWLLTTVITGQTASTPPTGVESTLLIEGDRLTIQGGCNRGGATVTITDGVLTTGPFMMTKMACEPAGQALDQTLLDVFGAAPTSRVEGQNLFIDADTTSLVYVARN